MLEITIKLPWRETQEIAILIFIVRNNQLSQGAIEIRETVGGLKEQFKSEFTAMAPGCFSSHHSRPNCIAIDRHFINENTPSRLQNADILEKHYP